MIDTEFKEQLLKHKSIDSNYHVIWNHLDINFESSIWHRFYPYGKKGVWIAFPRILREIKKDYDTHRVHKDI